MKTFKIAVNKSSDPFSLSEKALKQLRQDAPAIPIASWYFDIHCRTHPALINVIETLKEEASADNAEIIVETHQGNSFALVFDPFSKREEILTQNTTQWIQVWPQNTQTNP